MTKAAATPLRVPAGEISILIEGDTSEALAILAHGAGGALDSDFMAAMADLLTAEGIGVCRFNFPYMEAGRRSPDRAPVLEDTYSAVAAFVATEAAPRKLVLGGKSLGGRIASHIVANGEKADGLVFLGYPLHPPGRPDRMRDVHLKEIDVPMLFVEGTRDPFCPLATLEQVRATLRAPTEVAVIDDGDHSLKVRASSGRRTSEAWSEAAVAAAAWIKSL